MIKYVFCVDMKTGETMFLQRAKTEDPGYRIGRHRVKQIIPYVVLVNKHGQVAVFRRVKGDERLRGNVMIGVGGHVEPFDYGENILEIAASREIEEEVGVRRATLMDTGITIDDDSTPVNSVHIGHVFVALVKETIVCKDEELEFLGWTSVEDLPAEMESWTLLITGDIKRWLTKNILKKS